MIIIALDKQIHIYSVDTSAFYNEKEQKLYKKLQRLYKFKNILKQERIKESKAKNTQRCNKINKYYKRNNKRLKKRKEEIQKLFKENYKIRQLQEKAINKYNIVSVFESSLNRILQMKTNEISTNLIIVTAYFFEILEDIVEHGFIYKDEKYVCLTASAGQIRKKKTVFIKEKLLLTYYNTITCGLSLQRINERGGVNVNKYLAYTALNNSATDLINNFNINKTIVVPDMETEVAGTVDFISDKTYKIERKENELIPVPHTDGCGMIIPSMSKKNMMIRLPWVKGLLISFPFDKFVKEKNEDKNNINNINYGIVTDIYGQKHDILKEDIQIIFTESQFKMHKYYKNWDEYKNNFIKYNCQAGKCNEEEDDFEKAKINYQMLQTLIDMSDKELKIICNKTIKDIKNIGSDVDIMMRVLGVSTKNRNKNYLQKSLKLYPEMLQDQYCREVIKQVKKSMVKHARSGRITINGTYTFISPDLYAFCEFLFLHKSNPKGLLNDGEVYCNVFRNYKELDCLRSPHLYIEHAIRKNIIDKEKAKWFTTNALYTSCHDLISKILMFDRHYMSK